MTTLPATTGQGKGSAIQTNGEGNPCTSHLNLTVTMADAVRIEVDRHSRAATMTAKRRYERQPKIPYAGKDHHV